jgi:hypothetical protein
MPAYEGWRQAEIEEALAEGEAKVIPSNQTALRLFGSWPRALHQAGLIEEDELALARQQGPRRLSDDEVLAWLIEALDDIGPDEGESAGQLTRAEYRRWRLGRLRSASQPAERPVSDMLIYERFTAWALALEQANELLAKKERGA